MKGFFNRIEELQELYRALSIKKIDVLVKGNKDGYEEKKKKIITQMKLVAAKLRENDEIDEFDFSDDEKFFLSVKEFLSKTEE